MHPALPEMVEQVLAETSLQVGVTTNGVLLEDRAGELRSAGLRRINLSVPSIRKDNYRRITGRNDLDTVIRGLDAVISKGLEQIKINVPIIRQNLGEIPEMLNRLLSFPGVVVRFFSILSYENERCYEPVPEGEVIERITAQLYRLAHEKNDLQALRRVVFRPARKVSGPYCGSCQQREVCCENAISLRLTCDGYLRPCLLNESLKVDFSKATRKAFEKAYGIARDLYGVPVTCSL